MDIKKILLSVSALVLVGVLSLGFVDSVFAYRGDSTQTGPNYTVERHAAMTKAFESNDYAAWKNLMQGRGMASRVITAENFGKFAEIHKLIDQGKYTEANTARQELGLGMGRGRMLK
ncbi:MAG: hypothetical protein A2418_01410 [Candidatus Brennerbacteria bacterium RIFOXYC1_FULL_41_11]|uniref:Uncharacterized protein n=1 Tax=Candidatus Brennerbacteria bacterium RIFOXYD1_FULL_41_16 TaxID=1797529 RepID=A0A1G1XKM8_9BACT|nr:MAG: hypothetical protein UU61_C0020G0005 [Parcubacteria group bacterium GW2011_GWB1_41_4]OGY38693.1 MAG: hypothetical protein A2391_00185 [Candidatus Brennerbacteria bacterium RIFOXYB1_FULL_41_13]OGY39229.1 MAG: hypothetical protein A2418_01410 [Candidatus Brennerbacteria bacterium RIFOXYC1_FULL_41_11]OGY40512.1 MAG: hypothetical protein A2570_02075 [Candidatus Brennerbacteria bacterium RIFOXYD1_FULL_41_16]